MHIHRYLLLIVLSCLILSNCTPQTNKDNSQLKGTLIVWHNWPEPKAAVLNSFLDSFMTVNPDVSVISDYVANETLRARYLDQVSSGLGPDIILGADTALIRDLVDAGHLANLAKFNIDTTEFMPHTVEALQMGDGKLYGVPFTAYTNVLYFNKDKVTFPASSLLELVEEAQEGHKIALPMDFNNAYWGIRAFEGQVVDKNGNVIVDDGFSSWLNWLLRAAEEPTIILNDDYQELRNSFIAGELSYFVGTSSDYSYLAEAMGDELVGVALLPKIQEPPGAYLELEAIAVSNVSANKTLAIDLIKFLTNRTHQRTLALSDLGQIPVNRLVNFDSRLAPTAAILREQSEYAVITPLAHVQVANALHEVGSDIYLQVLAGVMTPEDAAVALSIEVNRATPVPDRN